jgi:hypothetical protein
MANELEAQAQIGGVKPELVKRPITGFTVRNITPAVYLTGLYTASPQAKAAELSRLIDGLLDLGIWSSAEEAFFEGIPAGTFVLVDSGSLSEPREAAEAAYAREKNVRVEIVRKVKKKEVAA